MNYMCVIWIKAILNYTVYIWKIILIVLYTFINSGITNGFVYTLYMFGWDVGLTVDSAPSDYFHGVFYQQLVFTWDFKMASSGGEGEHEWTAAVRPLLSASYTAFETKELPQLIGSIINR